MDITQLFDISYYLSPQPGGEFLLGYGLLAFFLLISFSGRLVRKWGPQNKYFKKTIRKRFGKFIFLGVIGLLLTASRFADVPYFSMRLWVYLLFLLTLFFAVKTTHSIRKDYTKRLHSVRREKKRS